MRLNSAIVSIGTVLCAVGFLSVATMRGRSEEGPAYQTAPIPAAPSSEPAVRVFSHEELGQLVAPIALYPDVLLGSILIAATYPIEVAEAVRWLSQDAHYALQGAELTAMVEQMDWEPSVKSLVPFRHILFMMNDRLGWMQKLGDAFLAQQADLMDAVQGLRRQAMAAGTLVSNDRQIVRVVGDTIIIEPASASVVYVPKYDPAFVYGAWPYPDYPPIILEPWEAYYYPMLFGIAFGVGVGIIDEFWGWNHWDWDHRRIHVDVSRYNKLNKHHRPIADSAWRHDPYHRRGVPYRDPHRREQYAVPRAGSSDARQAYRGYDSARTLRSSPGPSTVPLYSSPSRDTVRQTPRLDERPPAAQAPRSPSGTRSPPIATQRPQLFEGIDRGRDVNRYAERGLGSRQSLPANRPAPAFKQKPPSLSPAPSHAAPPRTGSSRGAPRGAASPSHGHR